MVKLIKTMLGKKIYIEVLKSNYNISNDLAIIVYNRLIEVIDEITTPKEVREFVNSIVRKYTVVQLKCLRCKKTFTVLEVEKVFRCPSCSNMEFKTKAIEVLPK